jgi:ribosomal protein L11 methylase PrmA
MDNDQNATQATFDQAAENEFPILEVFSTGFRDASQDTLFAILREPDDQVNAGGFQTIAIF